MRWREGPRRFYCIFLSAPFLFFFSLLWKQLLLLLLLWCFYRKCHFSSSSTCSIFFREMASLHLRSEEEELSAIIFFPSPPSSLPVPPFGGKLTVKLPQRTEEMSPLFRGVRERRGHDVKKNFDGWPPPTYAGHKNVPSRSFGHIFFRAWMEDTS